MQQLRKYFVPGTVELDGKTVPVQIPNPSTRNIVPPGGMWVPDTAYWHQLAAEGSGELLDAAPASAQE
jgi:hypothetical protein